MAEALPFKVIHINVPRVKKRDIYHDLLTMSWRKNFLYFFAFFLFINSLFATIDWLNPGSLINSDDSWLTVFSLAFRPWRLLVMAIWHQQQLSQTFSL